jgi:hypothetical protein
MIFEVDGWHLPAATNGPEGYYSYLRGFRAHWVSAHSNLERLIVGSIGLSVLKKKGLR